MSKASHRYAPRAAPTRAERRKDVRERSHAERRGGRRGGFWRGPLPFVIGGLAIVAAIGWSVFQSQQQPAPAATGAAADQVVATILRIPADVYDKVGSGGVADPLKATTQPVLRGASGKPLIVYVGAEYCPYCASERWSLVVALSRFGTFQGLSLSTSSSTDVYPNTPTFSFRGSSYQSQYLELSAVETQDRTGKPIASTTPVQQASMDRSDPQGSIPFLSIADRFVAVGSGYPPDVLRGKSWTEIAAALSDPASPIARAVIGNADRITAAICKTATDVPASVCGSPAIRGLGAP